METELSITHRNKGKIQNCRLSHLICVGVGKVWSALCLPPQLCLPWASARARGGLLTHNLTAGKGNWGIPFEDSSLGLRFGCT